MRTPIDGQVMSHEQPAGRPLAARYEVGALLCGKYRMEALLGEGGMGAVWRACNVLLDLPVAIKLIRADLDRGALRARLQLEARSAAKLGHPSIVRVFDVGESELGDPFIVMEHLRGETLAQLISRERVSPTRAVQLLLPIIDALAMAHGRGIVHRDLKPDNLMLAHEEQHVCPKILDFGIAKLIDPRDSEHKLTEFGAVIGSPEYMSPEQARGREDIDASSDIWSTCVVLYETITGGPPFCASNCNALLRSIVEDAPKALSEHGVDEADLWQILERGLHKDRAQRYGDIAELGRALATWLAARGVSEDARGTTLDSKWLNRESDRPNSSPVAQISGTEHSPRRTQNSTPDSTGIARGPFTNTISPGTPRVRSARTLIAALCACALLTLPFFALMRSPRATAKPVSVHTTAGSVALTAATATRVAPAAATMAPPTTLLAVAEGAPNPSVTPLDEPLKTRASFASQRQPRPIPSPIRVQPAVPTQVLPNSVAAAKPDRALDLLPPY